MAAAMILWPIAAGRRANFFGSHFLVGWWGIAIVSLLASLAAFVVMISLRLVLLYGWRSRPGLPRWTGSATWLQVLGFQVLGFPLVLAAIHSSAIDAANLDGQSYWTLFFSNLGAAAIGAVAALILLTLASSLQALRPGARPDLFFPPNPLSRRLASAGSFHARLSRPSEWLSRLSRWIVSSVPRGDRNRVHRLPPSTHPSWPCVCRVGWIYPDSHLHRRIRDAQSGVGRSMDELGPRNTGARVFHHSP